MSKVDRRNFLACAFASGATVVSACGSKEDRTPPKVPASSEGEWAIVRDQFALSPDFIHLSALYVASHPKSVREAIERHRRGLDENPVGYLNGQINQNENRVLKAAGEYLGAAPDDIAITDSTTAGIGLVYNGIKIGPSQEFLTTEQNYYSTDEALRLKAERSGAQVRRVPLYDSIETVTEDEIVTNIVSTISPATRVVALTWVHSSTGLKLPLRLIADRIDEMNNSRSEQEQILLCADGVHGFGVENVEMDDLGCDFLMAGCHKWLFGPRGTGIVYGSERGWKNVSPTIPTFMDDSVRDAWITGDVVADQTTGKRMSPGGFKTFEHQWAMAEAFDFHFEIGKGKIAARTNELNLQMKEGLAAMPHVKLYTPMSEDLSAGLVCFDVDGMSAQSVVNRLRQRRIVATVTPYADSYARVAPSILNSPEEIETVLSAIRALV